MQNNISYRTLVYLNSFLIRKLLSVGVYYPDFQINRQEAIRYGLRVKDIQDVITSAIGGMNISQTSKGREPYPINVLCM